MTKKEIIKLDTKSDLMKLLKSSTEAISEFILGIVKSDRADWIDSSGRLFDAVLKNRLIIQLGNEIERYRQEGKIKQDFLETDCNQMSFKELLNIIDDDPPDEVKFNAIKSLFLAGVAKSSSEKDEILTYQYLQITKSLCSGELLMLKAAYQIANYKPIHELRNVSTVDPSKHNWLNAVARQAGFVQIDLADLYSENLVRLKLLLPIDGKNPEQVLVGDKYRLTTLGVSLCEYMMMFDNE